MRRRRFSSTPSPENKTVRFRITFHLNIFDTASQFFYTPLGFSGDNTYRRLNVSMNVSPSC